MTREDYEPSEDDNQLVTGVEGDDGGLGYFGFSYYEGAADQLNLVGIDSGDGCVKPSTESHPGRLLQAALAPAVHVPEREGDGPSRGQGVHGVRARQPEGDRRGVQDRAAHRPSRQTAAKGALEKAEQGAGVVSSLAYSRTPRSVGEQAVRYGLFAAAAVSILTTVLIVLSLLRETIRFFGDVPLGDFVFGTKWTPLLGGDQQSFGVIPLLTGTLYLTAIGLVVAIPLGLLAAIYLSEYAPRRVRKVVKPVLELLAGVPTIVFGYFALTFFTPEVLRGLFGIGVNQFNALSAGIILGLLVLPTIASVAEDALTAVPASLREGAFGLGASKLQVSLRVVFPAALSGVVAALILGASRAVGETVIILVAGGQVARLGVDPTQGYQSMAAFIAATSRGDIPTGSIKFETIFVVGMALFLITLALNSISIRLVRRYRQVYE